MENSEEFNENLSNVEDFSPLPSCTPSDFEEDDVNVTSFCAFLLYVFRQRSTVSSTGSDRAAGSSAGDI